MGIIYLIVYGISTSYVPDLKLEWSSFCKQNTGYVSLPA